MNRLPSLFVAAALAIASVTGAQSAPVNLTGTALNGPLAGAPLFGSGTFDPSLVPSIGSVTLTQSAFPEPNFLNDPTLSLSLTIFGQIFTEAKDIAAPFLPKLTFADGVLTIIDFIVSGSDLFNPTAINQPDVREIIGFDVLTTQTGAVIYNVTPEYAAIPLPGGLPLALGAIATLGTLRMARGTGRRTA